MANERTEKIVSFLLDHPKGYNEEDLRAARDAYLWTALAREREDLIEWIPVSPGMRVLEFGAGLGEHTGVFLRRGAMVDAVEADADSMKVISARFDGEPALRLYSDVTKIFDEPRSRYDIILVYDGFMNDTVFRYTAGEYSSGSALKRLGGLFSRLKDHLTERGRIVFTTENRLGIKRLSEGNVGGSDVNYGKAAFSRSEIDSAVKDNGLTVRFYYPAPDLYFPEYIYSDRHLPDADDASYPSIELTEGTVRAFYEPDALKAVAEEGLYPELAASFCCIIENENGSTAPKLPVFVKYSVRRRDEFKIVTELKEGDKGELTVRKRPYDADSEEHISRLSSVSAKLATLYMRSGLLPVPMEGVTSDIYCPFGAADFKFAEGTPLSVILDEYILMNDIDGFFGIMDGIRSQMLSVQTEDFVDCFDRRFTEIFGIGEKNAKDMFANERCAKVCDIDLMPSNIIANGDREWIIDWEWTFDIAVPFSFLWYRFIRYYVNMRPYRQRILGRLPYRKYDIAEDMEKVFCAMEEAFLLYVNSDRRPMHTELKDILPEVSYLKDMEEQQQRITAAEAYAFSDGRYIKLKESDIRSENFAGDISDRLVEIAVPSGCSRLRFDPASSFGILTVEYVQSGDGRALPYDTNCTKELSDRGMLFATDDPQMIIPLQSDTSVVKIKYGYDVLLAPDVKGKNSLIAAWGNLRLLRRRLPYACGKRSEKRENSPVIKEMRLLVSDEDVLAVYGYFPEGNRDTDGIELFLDGEELAFERIRSPFRANTTDIPRENMIDLRAPLKAGWRDRGYFVVKSDGETVFRISVKDVDHKLLYRLDGTSSSENTEILMGWAISLGDVEIEAKSASGVPQSSIRRVARYEINQEYGELSRDALYGFEIRLKHEEGESVYPVTVTFSDGKEVRHEELLDPALSVGREPNAWDRIRHYGRRSMEVLKTDGVKGVIKKARQKLSRGSADSLSPYDRWILQNEPDAGELLKQRDESAAFKNGPKLSVVVPLYHTKPDQLGELILSLKAQTYENWELCLTDASAEDGGESELTGVVGLYGGGDERIVYNILRGNGGISENTNAAIALATGEYIVFLDHDDLISANALYECALAILNEPETDFIYTDHDYIDESGEHRSNPFMKPDYSPDFMRSCNYILHLHVVKKTLLNEVGALNSEYDGAQDYDLTLRICEKARHIVHIPKVLYHWRASEVSTAGDPAAKEYVYEAGKRALEAHYERVGIRASVMYTHHFGWYHTVYELSEKPLVSVIIPNKDHAEDLKKCIDSILDKEEYDNIEIRIIENNSTDAATFDYYETLTAADKRISVDTYQGSFNYSKINNFGASKANGEYLLFLNNDTEMINGRLITELLGYASREDVGAVGARLLYEDETIQHAGIVIGSGFAAANIGTGLSRAAADENLYTAVAQNRSAVTAACMMTRTSVFKRVGGFSEELVLAFNDADYCLKVRRLGKLIVYDPYAEAYHYESKTRGLEDTPEKKARFDHEKEMFLNRWRHMIDMGDPFAPDVI